MPQIPRIRLLTAPAHSTAQPDPALSPRSFDLDTINIDFVQQTSHTTHYTLRLTKGNDTLQAEVVFILVDPPASDSAPPLYTVNSLCKGPGLLPFEPVCRHKTNRWLATVIFCSPHSPSVHS